MRDRPTVSSLILFLFLDMWGGSRVCALRACYGLVMHYLPFSHNLCARPKVNAWRSNVLVAHRVRERMNVPGPHAGKEKRLVNPACWGPGIHSYGRYDRRLVSHTWPPNNYFSLSCSLMGGQDVWDTACRLPLPFSLFLFSGSRPDH